MEKVLEFRDGYVCANDRPGLGVDIDEKEAEKYPCTAEVTTWTQTRHRDGALQIPQNIYMVLIGTEVGLRDGTQITVTGMVDKLIQKALGVMLKQPSGGKIINIASIVSWFGGTTVLAYTASNGAVIPVDGAYLVK